MQLRTTVPLPESTSGRFVRQLVEAEARLLLATLAQGLRRSVDDVQWYARVNFFASGLLSGVQTTLRRLAKILQTVKEIY